MTRICRGCKQVIPEFRSRFAVYCAKACRQRAYDVKRGKSGKRES